MGARFQSLRELRGRDWNAGRARVIVRGPQILKDSRGIGLEITRRKEHEDKASSHIGYERKALIYRAADKEGWPQGE